MPYLPILRRLLESVDGALGAGFVDYDGETVQLVGQFEEYAHRVHLACQGIFLDRVKAVHQRQLDPPSSLLCVYQGYTLIIKPLNNGYFLALTLAHRKALSKAFRAVEEAAMRLNLDL
jgi:hypothetical protein